MNFEHICVIFMQPILSGQPTTKTMLLPNSEGPTIAQRQNIDWYLSFHIDTSKNFETVATKVQTRATTNLVARGDIVAQIYIVLQGINFLENI